MRSSHLKLLATAAGPQEFSSLGSSRSAKLKSGLVVSWICVGSTGAKLNSPVLSGSCGTEAMFGSVTPSGPGPALPFCWMLDETGTMKLGASGGNGMRMSSGSRVTVYAMTACSTCTPSGPMMKPVQCCSIGAREVDAADGPVADPPVAVDLHVDPQERVLGVQLGCR